MVSEWEIPSVRAQNYLTIGPHSNLQTWAAVLGQLNEVSGMKEDPRTHNKRKLSYIMFG
jgi:hypothetical protein